MALVLGAFHCNRIQFDFVSRTFSKEGGPGVDWADAYALLAELHGDFPEALIARHRKLH